MQPVSHPPLPELSTSVSYRDKIRNRAKALEDTETPKLKKRLIQSLGFLLILMYFSMGHSMLGWP